MNDANILNYRDMMTIRRMLKALSSDVKDYRRDKGWNANSKIDGMLTFFKELRRKSRDRSDDTLAFPRSFQKNEAKKIKNLLTNLCVKRKFNTTVIVGGKDAPTCKFESNPYRRQPPTVTLVVGHMWGKRVWDNIYTSMENQRLTNTDYIILSAVEYRTNVRHVRLFEATAYGIKEKEKVNGWIGQSRIGSQPCTFKADKLSAIRVAEELTVMSVNTQLKPID